MRSRQLAALAHDSASVALGCAAPHAGLLTKCEGVFKAIRLNRARCANGLCRRCLDLVVGIEHRRVKASARPQVPPFQLWFDFLYLHDSLTPRSALPSTLTTQVPRTANLDALRHLAPAKFTTIPTVSRSAFDRALIETVVVQTAGERFAGRLSDISLRRQQRRSRRCRGRRRSALARTRYRTGRSPESSRGRR